LTGIIKEAVPGSGARELLLWLVRRRRRFRVTGASMLPALKPGDVVLADPSAYRHSYPQPGDIVIARHPLRRDVYLVKRVSAVMDDGRCRLEGDNPAESTDSRTFGLVAAEQVRGRVTSRFA
jgi:nickel-type superoxide dismutase maturation protease